jgi:hypothetical protein
MWRVGQVLFLTVMILAAYARVGFAEEHVFMTCDSWNKAERNPATKGGYVLWLQGYWEGLAWPQLSAAISNNSVATEEQVANTLRPFFPTHMSMDAVFVEITSRCENQPAYTPLFKIVTEIAHGP